MKNSSPKKSIVKLNGLKHTFYTWGSPKKPKIFFVHGWMDTAASFHFIASHLQDSFHCIALDLRGFGQTEHTHNPLGYFFYEYLADVHQFFNFLSPHQPIDCVGHSMGGNILSFYAGVFPQRIRSFVNLEGFGIQDMPYEQGPERMRQWLQGLNQPVPLSIYKNKEDMARRLRQVNPALDVQKSRFLASYMTKKYGKKVIVSADTRHKLPGPYLFRLENFYAFISCIQARCFLIAGGKTNMEKWMKGKGSFGKELKKRLRRYPASSKKIILPDCGHMMHHEQPAQLAELICNFLK